MSSNPAEEPAAIRVFSLDAYRGFVMFLMMAEVFPLGRLAEAFPDSEFCRLLAYHQTHVEWRGCSLHDMIQPSFSFLVGVALLYSLASRRKRGESQRVMLFHAVWRSVVLVFLGVFLRSLGGSRTNYTFEDTLSQIGLGYLPLFLIGLGPPKARWIALVVILVGYWSAFALYPLPGPDFDYTLAGVSPDWPHHATGFAAHWNKNTNPAWAFDRWFLNLFPRERPFTNNGGGYATLSFIPTLGTMLLGLIAGGWLRAEVSAARKIGWLVVAGLTGLALGYGADRLGICPNVKRIWTPSWVLFSGGWCFLLLAGFYAIIDVAGFRAWSFPLRVIGANSIAAYLMAHLMEDFVTSSLRTHLGQEIFRVLGAAHEPLVAGAAVLAIFWLILFWMYQRRIFLRV
ncbi:MAG: DUF5009 domain-containing protein [Isosphaeraceae bacterium]